MPLTPDEEKRLREEVRKQLEIREQRMLEGKRQENKDRQRNIEDRLRRQIKEDEEEQYFVDRGYVKHVNRYGGVEWLKPEEAETRQSRRRSGKKKGGGFHRKARARKKYTQWAINVTLVMIGAAVLMFLLRYNPNRATGAKTGAAIISTDVPGAQIYLNGNLRQGVFTPDTLKDLKPGNHFISVYKEGYATWPPMQRIVVKANIPVSANFELKNSGRLGKLSVYSNLKDFKIFVNGIARPLRESDLLELPAGYHVISVVKEGYLANPLFRRILVEEQKVKRVEFDFSNREDFGYLKVTSNRSGGYVYLDEQLSGIKPNGGAFPVPVGVYEVRICEQGYQSVPSLQLLRINAGETTALSFNMDTESASDTLHILTRVPGATVMINGESTPYVTPLPDFVLNEGTHYINLMRNDRLFSKKDIRVDVNALNENRLILDF